MIGAIFLRSPGTTTRSWSWIPVHSAWSTAFGRRHRPRWSWSRTTARSWRTARPWSTITWPAATATSWSVNRRDTPQPLVVILNEGTNKTVVIVVGMNENLCFLLLFSVDCFSLNGVSKLSELGWYLQVDTNLNHVLYQPVVLIQIKYKFISV